MLYEVFEDVDKSMESDLRRSSAGAVGAILLHERRIPAGIILSGARQGGRNLHFLGLPAKQRFGQHCSFDSSM